MRICNNTRLSASFIYCLHHVVNDHYRYTNNFQHKFYKLPAGTSATKQDYFIPTIFLVVIMASLIANSFATLSASPLLSSPASSGEEAAEAAGGGGAPAAVLPVAGAPTAAARAAAGGPALGTSPATTWPRSSCSSTRFYQT